MSVQKTVKVKVPGLSSFDKSFKNILTTHVGTITPICSKYVMPGAKGSLKIAISACLPPLASDTFMRCSLKTEAFLVPLRLLYGGFESWLTGSTIYDEAHSTRVRASIPRLVLGGISAADYNADLAVCGAGSLSDYLGLRPDTTAGAFPGSASYYNLFPFLAYHRVWNDWYRNARVTENIFIPPVVSTQNNRLSYLPFISNAGTPNYSLRDTFLDGVTLGSLRQRNYGEDYYTVAMPSAQQGTAQSITITGGALSIPALRAGNSVQQFTERSGYASPRMQDYVKAHYNADLASGVAQRAILLGSASYDVYSKGVDAQAAVSATNNPFTSVGAQYGRAYASGSDFVCKFDCNEPSYLMVMATLVPEANYASGMNHELLLLNSSGSQVDLPDPLLENTGNEPIYAEELSGLMFGNTSGTPNRGAVFGYVPKNTWYKTSRNEVHGALRAGQSLDSFVAQRNWVNSQPQLSTAFLKINTTDLNNVTAVSSELSTYGCWIDSFIDLKVAEPLVESALPSLQDPSYEHGSTVSLNQKESL